MPRQLLREESFSLESLSEDSVARQLADAIASYRLINWGGFGFSVTVKSTLY